jgi:transcription elongation factor Elf1
VATGTKFFNCPNCNALYQIIKIEAGSESPEITCRACGGPLQGRDGKFVVKYFLLRKAARVQRWVRV